LTILKIMYNETIDLFSVMKEVIENSFIKAYINFIYSTIKLIFSLISNIYYSVTGNIYYLTQKCFKYAIIILIVSLISIILTLSIYLILEGPSTVSKKILFHFDQENNNTLIAKLKVNCKGKSKDLCLNDIKLDYSYKVFLELNILRNEKGVRQGNFETEIQMLNRENKMNNIKKVSFIEENDDLTEYTKKILYLPFRILGYFREETMQITHFKKL